MYGTVYHILSAFLVLLFLRDERELSILVSFCCVMTYKFVYYRAPVSAAYLALLSCMYVLFCTLTLINVQVKIFIQ